MSDVSAEFLAAMSAASERKRQRERNCLLVWDTWGREFWASTSVTYGCPSWPSYSHWIVYDAGLT